MSISMALFSPPTTPANPHSLLLLHPHKPCFHHHKPALWVGPTKPLSLVATLRASSDSGGAVTVEEEPSLAAKDGNGTAAATASASPPPPVVEKEEEVKVEVAKFVEPRWVGGTWDLSQFMKDGKTDWDAVIDAEAKRRKWLENNPESSNNSDPVVFDTSIVPWWVWMKRFHLPEAELLNGRAAMVGFFMAYFVDSLTGVGLVDQMGNFFCKTLLFVAVAGVLLIRKNEDLDNLKKLFDETTFYDKQWQAAWQDETPNKSKPE